MKDEILGALPDVLTFENGKKVTDIPAWEERRKEILEKAVLLEYGGMPPKPEVFRLEKLCEDSYRIHCGTKEKQISFCFDVYKPEGKGKRPVVLTGDAMYHRNCNDRVIEEANRRGFLVVKFNRCALAPDCYTSERTDGIYPLYPELAFSAISAWAWGYHRVVDALLQLDFVDADRIAITGHSRGGKAVLLAGATDERIRYVNPNGSGTHGCGCYRYIQHNDCTLYNDERSEPLSFLFEAVPYWMGAGMRDYIGREAELPHDSHFFKALVAPRLFLETNACGDIWANPKGSYLSFLAAKEVWKLYGQERNCQTWYRNGVHRHGWEDFNALFDFMEADINSTPMPASMTRIPYEDECFRK